MSRFLGLILPAAFALSACTTIPKNQKTAQKRIMGVGIVELEHDPKLDRGASIGSFAYPVKFSESDYFVGTLGGYFGRFDTLSGSYKWKKRFRVGVASEPVVRGDRVYVGAMDGAVYCFDLKDG